MIFWNRSRVRNRRSFSPSVLCLEGRQLLDGSVSAGVIANFGGQTPIVGGHFELQATQQDFVPYAPGTVASTTWTITGAYSGVTLDGNGYHPQTLQTVTVPGDTISGYWNEQAGEHAVAVTVNFVQPTFQGVPIPNAYWPTTIASVVNVATPSLSISTQFGRTYLDNSEGTTALETYDPVSMTAGFSVNASVVPGTDLGVGGSIGVVQTINPTLSYYQVVNGWPQRWDGFLNPDLTPSGVILDKLPTSPDPYYNGTRSVGGIFYMDDSPHTTINDQTYRLVVKDSFNDTVMYTPTGGIPVPLTTASWSTGGVIARDAQGTPYLSSKTDPSFVTSPLTGQVGWSNSYLVYPGWNGRTTDYMNGNSQPIIYQVPLSWNYAQAVYPIFGSAAYWDSINDPYFGPYDNAPNPLSPDPYLPAPYDPSNGA